jgi:hypothetical protein
MGNKDSKYGLKWEAKNGVTEIVAEVFGISVFDKKELLGKPFNRCLEAFFSIF